MIKVGMISLGCPRTLVDSEILLGRLKTKGIALADEVTEADVAIVNTCGFIEESVRESVDTVMQLAALKKEGKLKAVVVAGCLAQRFKQGLFEELTEADGIVGVDAFEEIDAVVQRVMAGQRSYTVRARPHVPHFGLAERVALTPSHYGYLKISEGCLRGCSFCIIPKLKGPLHSRPMEMAVAEARRLVAERGCRELIVVGQDTSDYGADLYGRPRLAELLDALSRIPGVRWVRLLYCHPRGVTEELMQVMASRPTICKYLDMAIEHSEDAVLQRMNRGMTRAELLALIQRLRDRVPGIALRTSLIVGFPGETDAEFQGLLDFLSEVRFERLGAFRYSREEGTASYHLADQVPPSVAEARFRRVMELQQRLSAAWLERQQGRTVEVHIDEPMPETPGWFLGRTSADCPEVDGVVHVDARQARVAPGDFVPVTITDTYEYDLVGSVVREPAE